MSLVPDQILEDLSPYADLGTESPTATKAGDSFVVKLIRNGERVQLSFQNDGAVVQTSEHFETKHFSFKSLLASPGFADLGRWADMQKIIYAEAVQGNEINLIGEVAGEGRAGDVAFVDDYLVSRGGGRPRTSVLLLSGPAGIGKTTFIRQLALCRAQEYRRRQRPLLLHVESRGRTLQNITDLIAFSLQTLRVSVTYDQVPTLVRHGLVTLAIDGFDELGDPNGYGLAWASVNELISESRGEGALILAGRETFINREQMEKTLTSIDQHYDQLSVIELQPLRPQQAKDWLKDHGWSESLLDSDGVAPLFERGSYALRPFFLRALGDENVAAQVESGAIEDLLNFLINSMIQRESSKFGRDIEAATTHEDRTSFIERLMEEIARDLADNQTDSLSSETLAWLTEIAASGLVGPELMGILKNRAGVMAFLSNDERRGYKRFSNEQFSNYFLSRVTIDAVLRGEVPKYVRRNIMGRELLENFCSVARVMSEVSANKFVSDACEQIRRLGDADRARQNLAALVVAACGVANPTISAQIENINIDELYFSETSSSIYFRGATICQIYAMHADISEVTFEGSYVISLIADNGTVLPKSFPEPATLILPDRFVSDAREISAWVGSRVSGNMSARGRLVVNRASFQKMLAEKYPILDLLFRVARHKPFWIKDSDERSARRILDDPNWEQLRDLMIKHDLILVMTDVPSSGRPAPFYHVKYKTDILLLTEKMPENFQEFLSDILKIAFGDAD